MSVTINDVAKRAKVSDAAVSVALRGGGNSNIRVSPKTCERILKAARELGYSTNILAQGLRKGKTHTIGLILEGLGGEASTMKAAGVEEMARKNGYRVFSCYHDAQVELEVADVRDLVARQVDGIIMVPVFKARPHEFDHLKRLADQHFPLVIFYGRLPFPVSSVTVDNVHGGMLAIRHLVQIDRRKIAFIGGNPAYTSTRDRTLGWRKGCEEAGLDFDAMPFREFGWAIEENVGYRICREFLDSGVEFNALVTSNDYVALGAIKAISERGMKIPEDIAIIGFDDSRFSSYLPVPLTTIHQPSKEVGITAFQVLLNRMQNPELPVEEMILKPTLVVRGSTMVSGTG